MITIAQEECKDLVLSEDRKAGGELTFILHRMAVVSVVVHI